MSAFDFAGNCQAVTPELPVLDLAGAQKWLHGALAFETAWVWMNDFAAVQCGEVQLYLRLVKPPVSPVRCYLHVKNADALYKRCVGHAAMILDKLDSKPWGAREFAVQSPDGHVFRIGHGEKRVDEIEAFKLQN